MKNPRKIACIIGTRPEVIKMAPIIQGLKASPDAFSVQVVATAQHRDLLDQATGVFGIRPDVDLDVMQTNQTLSQITSTLINRLSGYLEQERPDVVLAQGDTTTVMTTALCCYYHGIAFGHVEAGLRTGDLQEPFPEEFNRRAAGILANYHFAPTQQAADNLLKEGANPQTVHVTGNTVIDALNYVLEHTEACERPVPSDQRYILVTCHRREIFGEQLKEILETIGDIARQRTDVAFWYPVHPNPKVHGPAYEILDSVPNVFLTDPLDYKDFAHAMNRAYLLLTDSGGIQEEAPALGKPVLVLRDKTERPEGIEAGTCMLVGPHRSRIMEAVKGLLDDPEAYQDMSHAVNPYGDGQSAQRIINLLRD